jgi:PiT family inorganic phosphate transporter
MSSETGLLLFVLLAGFYMAWNIGANDVANAMGTSVGSGALTLRRAVVLAAILEFSGAFFFGSHVSETVQRGIINPDMFISDPMMLAYGMLASLLAAGVWLQIASYYGWPVSTTHSIVGAVLGFGVAVGGIQAIYWKNVAWIFSSWLLSPLCGALISFLIFNVLRQCIFYSEDPVRVAKRLTPLFVFIVVFTLSLVLIFQGLHHLVKLSLFGAAAYSVLIASVASLVSHLLVKRVKATPSIHTEYAVVERIFAYLQIMSACLMAFAHGANDVANAIGPLAASFSIITTGVISSNATVPTWSLALGGIGIVIGLATWGWRVIETIGRKITELTPTRGFAAEFGTAMTVLLASQLGLPISTTHTLVGSVIGVGLARGVEALNLTMTRDIFISWMVTIPVGAGIAIFFSYVIKMVF